MFFMESTDKFSTIWNTLLEGGAQYLPKVLLAAITLVVGLWLIRQLLKVLNGVFASQHFDDSLASFLRNLVGVALKVLVVVSAIGMLGVQTSSFIAILGATGLAVGLALQGSLANFAGGVLVLIFKPFKVDDYIEITEGYSGYVKDIQIFSTILQTLDNHTVIVPNAIISNGVVDNYSQAGHKRMDVVFGIGYNDDIDEAKKVLLDIVSDHKNILQEPKPSIFVGELADSSVNLTARFWMRPRDTFSIKGDLFESAKKAFDREGIQIPFPQQDIHHYYEGKWPEKTPTEVEV